MLKQKLRRFIVWSSFPPFVSVYRGIYRLVIQLSLFVLRRYRGIISIYLCRGCAKNEIIPGISDIDFVLVTTNDSEERRSIKNAFRTLGRTTCRLIDYYSSLVISNETLEHRWRTSPAWQYRYFEGKTTWKLLYGTDVLNSLPKLNEAQLSSSSYNEMCRWWLTFAHQLLGSKSNRQDIIMRNVICYKTISELLNALMELPVIYIFTHDSISLGLKTDIPISFFPSPIRLLCICSHSVLLRYVLLFHPLRTSPLIWKMSHSVFLCSSYLHLFYFKALYHK